MVSFFDAMGDFVNYKKRSASLPPGCKDLIDVLSRRLERRFQKFAVLGVNSEEAMKILISEEVKSLLTELEKREKR
jgi:hypothetical protein